MKNSRDQRNKLKHAIGAIRMFEKENQVKPVSYKRIHLPDGAKSIVGILADGRQYACGYI